MKRTLLLFTAALLSIGVLAGCSGDKTFVEPDFNTTSTTPESAAGTSFTIKGFAFDPASVSVSPGTAVPFTNDDTTTHSVSPGTPSEPSTAWTEKELAPGDTFEVTISEPGDYDFYCKFHNSMVGTISVNPS